MRFDVALAALCLAFPACGARRHASPSSTATYTNYGQGGVSVFAYDPRDVPLGGYFQVVTRLDGGRVSALRLMVLPDCGGIPCDSEGASLAGTTMRVPIGASGLFDLVADGSQLRAGPYWLVVGYRLEDDAAWSELDPIRVVVSGSEVERPPATPPHVRADTTVTVLFAFDSATVPHVGCVEDYLHSFVSSQRVVEVSIDGYTDSVGAVTYNLELSSRRALAVAVLLPAESSADVRGRGIRYVGDNDTSRGRQLNRRADVSITYEETDRPVPVWNCDGP